MSRFRADCSRCCGLCCVAPAQLAVQGFGVDKPAARPCAHLNEQNRCAIYAQRSKQGYPACESFDCYGAGQWVTETLSGGADWTASPDLAREMFAAYSRWLPRFEAAALIEAALPHVRDDARSSLAAMMSALTTNDLSGAVELHDEKQLRPRVLGLIRSALMR